jgi:hypothetical protein
LRNDIQQNPKVRLRSECIGIDPPCHRASGQCHDEERCWKCTLIKSEVEFISGSGILWTQHTIDCLKTYLV